MLPSVSSPPWIVIGNPGSRRVELFQAALTGLGLVPAQLAPYAELLSGRVHLSSIVQPGSVVRIESPGRDFEVEQMLLALGAAEPDEEGQLYERLEPEAVAQLVFDKGLMLPLRQWYRGLRAALRLIEGQLMECPPHRLIGSPADILAMFDKRLCHSRLEQAGVPVPQSIGPIESYEQLVAAMASAGMARVFIKPAHGSSAAGIIAYQTARGRSLATTTVEMVEGGGALLLYTTRRLREERDHAKIARLINAICRQRVHVEQWIPKAGINGHAFDLRVVMIAGQARHTVVRMSRGPMTNLHLLNERGSWDAVRERMGEAAWERARTTCKASAACFPASLHAGIDLLITQNFRRHLVLEVNAFGDLLPGVLSEGEDTYTAEIRAILDTLLTCEGGRRHAMRRVPTPQT